jgi:hypothetical protein
LKIKRAKETNWDFHKNEDMRTKPNDTLRIIGITIYLVGILSGITLTALSAWGDIEASTFDAALQTNETLDTLECPVFIGKEERGVITAEIVNTAGRDVAPVVRARITQGYTTLVREERDKIEIAAGQSAHLSWEVTAEDAAYQQFILARIYQFANYSLPSRQSTCGIMVVPLSGLTGQQFFILLFASNLIFSTIGLVLYTPKTTADSVTAKKKMRAFIFLGVYLLVAPLLNLLGNWLLSGALVVFAFLSLIVVISYSLMGVR